jgi:DNA-binding IclR family transcriptional regulator
MVAVKSAVRALEVLEQFGELRQPLRLKDIARNLRYPTSSTAALLKSLADCGYLTFDRNSRQYYPTSKLPDLGSRLASATLEDGSLMDTMHTLQQSTGELIVVGTPNDIFIDYIKSLRSTQPIQLYTPAGTRRLMIQSGMGWLLLSRMERMNTLRIYQRTIVAGELRPSDFSERQLVDRLQKLRDSDYVFTRSSDYVKTTAHIGGAMIAMLVPTPPGHRSLVLGVGGPADRLSKNREDIVKQMRSEIERLADVVEGKAPPRIQTTPPRIQRNSSRAAGK